MTLKDYLGTNPNRKISFKPKSSGYNEMKIFKLSDLLKSLPKEWLNIEVVPQQHPTTKQWQLAYLNTDKTVYEVVLTDFL